MSVGWLRTRYSKEKRMIIKKFRWMSGILKDQIEKNILNKIEIATREIKRDIIDYGDIRLYAQIVWRIDYKRSQILNGRQNDKIITFLLFVNIFKLREFTVSRRERSRKCPFIEYYLLKILFFCLKILSWQMLFFWQKLIRKIYTP